MEATTLQPHPAARMGGTPAAAVARIADAILLFAVLALAAWSYQL